MEKFDRIEHPADAGFRAFGNDLEEAFGNAALALTELMTNTDKIEPKNEITISLEAENLEALLYDWLDNFLYLFDAKGFVGSRFFVDSISKKEEEYRIEARIQGEEYDPEKHGQRTEVKAMTYHMMEIDQTGDEVILQVVVDI